MRTDEEAGRIIETASGGGISLTETNCIFPASAGLTVQDCGCDLLCVNHFSGERGGSNRDKSNRNRRKFYTLKDLGEKK